MSIDFGRLNVNTATTPETFISDANALARIRGSSIVSSIQFHAPPDNAGDVYVGITSRTGTTIMSATYGWTLEAGDVLTLNNISEKFENFQGDAATSGDDIEWVASYQTKAKA